MFIKLLLLFPLPAFALNIVSTLPEFAWVAKKLAPEAKVISLLNGNEDPHFVDASPAFVFKVAKADLVVINGMDLEVGWLPKVLQMSGNEKVQLGARGLCDASQKVEKIEVLKNYNRSMGDIHPAGNPHFSLSPLRMKQAVQSLAGCLKPFVDKQKLATVLKKLTSSLAQLDKELKNKMLSNAKFFVYHREFNYLKVDYGLSIMHSLEKTPGVLPSISHLSQMATLAKKLKPKKVLANQTAPEKILKKFQTLSGVAYLQLRLHPAVDEDYTQFIRETFQKITEP